MAGLAREWHRVLLGLLPIVLALVACSSATGVPSGGQDATLPEEPGDYLTINVDIMDDGIRPSTVLVPVGRGVQLVLRNRGSTEHHFRVLGMESENLLWIMEEELPTDTSDLSEDDLEHLEHHPDTGFLPFRAISNAGIRPLGDEVHAYALAGDVDMVLFIPTSTGTFLIQCPLHNKIVGKMIVFQ